MLTTAVVIDLLLVINRSSDTAKIPSLLMLPVAIVLGWLGLAAAVKRCHDLGQSGFYVLIPLYGLWLIFPDGTPGENEYGPRTLPGMTPASS